MADQTQEGEILLSQLNRLIGELLHGSVRRKCFRPWELELLMDIESSKLRLPARRELLRKYRKAVQRHYENASGPPPRFAHYLEALRARTAGDAAPAEAETETERLG
jgi:hypothetical protein